jgi:hypothetical protein
MADRFGLRSKIFSGFCVVAQKQKAHNHTVVEHKSVHGTVSRLVAHQQMNYLDEDEPILYQVAMDDPRLIVARWKQDTQSLQELPRKLSDQIQRYPMKASVFEQIVQIVRQQLKNNTLVIAVDETFKHAHCDCPVSCHLNNQQQKRKSISNSINQDDVSNKSDDK